MNNSPGFPPPPFVPDGSVTAPQAQGAQPSIPLSPTHPTWHTPYGQHPLPAPPPAVHSWVDYQGSPNAVVGSMWRPAAESGPPARLVAWGQRHATPARRFRRSTIMVGTLAVGLLATAAAMMVL